MQTDKTKRHRLSWLYVKKRPGSARERSIQSSPENVVSQESPRTVLHRRIDYRMRMELTSLADSIRNSSQHRRELLRLERERSAAQNELNMAFIDACKIGDYNEAYKIIQKNHIDLDAQDITSMGPAHFAAWHGKKEFLHMLMDKGVDPNMKGFEGRAALHFAAMFDHSECIEVLMRGGASVNQTDDYNWTPLHYAAASDSPLAIVALLAAGSDPNQQDDSGFTPGDLAASEELEEMLPKGKMTRGSCSGAGKGNQSIYFSRAKQQALSRQLQQQKENQPPAPPKP